MKIKVNGNEYEVKNNIKAMIVYEGITEKPFEIKTLTDFYTYCYAMVYANNTENVPEFDKFLEWFDDTEINNKFLEVMNTAKPELDGDKKKAKTTKK
jgi:hypothetical protein